METYRKHLQGAASRRVSRRRGLGVAAGVGAAAALAACGGKLGKSAGSATSQQAGKPRYGGQVASSIPTDPFDWDLSLNGKSSPNRQGFQLAYNSLLGFQTGPGIPYDKLTIRPELAQKWETPEAQTYTFSLRHDAKFANLPPVGGRPLTSADVKWSYEYASRSGQFQGKKLPAGQFVFMFEGLNRIETPDDYTVVVHFDRPFVPFLSYSASNDNPILPHEIYDRSGNFKDAIAGTGAFQLDVADSQHGSRWIWKKNPDYWNAGRPYLDQINWLVLPDLATTYGAFQAHQIDQVTANVAADADTIKRNNPSAASATYNVGHRYLYMNTAKPPLNDIRVRQALSLAMDRDEMIRSVTAGQGGWALAGAMGDTFTDQETKQIIKQDPAQAKQLMDAAGYTGGLELEFTKTDPVALVELYQAQLKRAGIDIALKPEDQATLVKRRKTSQFSLLLGRKPFDVDVDELLYAPFYPNSNQNYADVDDATLTQMLVAQRAAVDPSKRRDLVRQIVRYIYDKAYAFSFYWEVNTEFWQPYVHGYSPNLSVLGWVDDNTWIDK